MRSRDESSLSTGCILSRNSTDNSMRTANPSLARIPVSV
jgi:hypothetical protein